MKKVMFKWACLLLMVVSVAFTGCSKDDDNDDNVINATTLIGTWEAVSGRSYDKDVATGAISNELQDDYTETFRYVFMEDGSFEYQGEQTFPGTWRLEAKKLSVVMSNLTTRYDVIKLNASELIIISSYDRGTYNRCLETTFRKI
jgi:hypothetical protein